MYILVYKLRPNFLNKNIDTEKKLILIFIQTYRLWHGGSP